MKHIQNMKTVLAIAPQSLGSATAAEIEVDATGYNNARFLICVGAAAASANISVCKVQSAPTTGGSQTDVTGASIATAVIDGDADDTVHAIEVDLSDRNIGQFLSLVLTSSTANVIEISVVCILSEPNVSPTTAALRGLTTEAFA